MRYLVPILGLVLLIGGLAAVKYAQFSTLMQAGEAFAKAGPPPEAVSTAQASELTWEGTLSAVGTVAAERGVAVSNDAPGIVKAIRFESGAMAKAGQVLVELDTSVERAQLNTALVQKELAEKNAVRSQDLFARGVTTQAELDSAQSALQGAEAQVATLRAQIARKIVRAPFRGKLGIRAVNLGQYLAPGTTISTLEALDSVYVDFTLPQQTLESLSTGLPVRISLDEGNLQAEGQIAAISPSLDASTRSVRVRAAVPNIKGQLRPGMFATVSVVLPERTSKRVAIPITALVRAPYGDSVFIVGPAKASAGATENTATPVRTARQQFVRVGPEQGDFVAVLDGVKAGEEVVTEGAFKLRNGANVTVHNEVRPEPEVHPHPDNH